MNHKVITAIICLLIVGCLSVGIGMNLKGSNTEKAASGSFASSEVSEKNGTEDGTFSETEKESESTRSAPEKTTYSKTEKQTEISSNSENTTQVRTEKQTGASSNKEKQTQVSEKATNPKTSVRHTEANSEKETQAQIQVVFSVNCERAAAYGADYPKYLINRTKCHVKKGTTVFDLLSEQCSRNGIAVVHQNKSYIVSIGGLAEKDCGNSSGWMYTVNGKKPMTSASKYVLQDGDVVEWYYVTSPTD